MLSRMMVMVAVHRNRGVRGGFLFLYLPPQSSILLSLVSIISPILLGRLLTIIPS